MKYVVYKLVEGQWAEVERLEAASRRKAMLALRPLDKDNKPSPKYVEGCFKVRSAE